MRSGLFLPLFDPLADPAAVARLAGKAEEAGWDGFFVWDQIHWREPVAAVGDTQVTLAAIAVATERIRLGPLVTPLARRRPAKVARETAALDLLSGGRLTLGVGLGSDRFASEYSITGEELDDRRRARMLDEALEILKSAWSGEPVRHRGEHYTVDPIRFCPGPYGARAFRFGWRAFPAIPGRCAAPPATTASSRSTSTARTNSPRSSPASTSFAKRQATVPRTPTTWSPRSNPASTRRPTARLGRRGASWLPSGRAYPLIRSAA